METLKEYLDRVMRQKNLKLVDLAKRCQVSDSYIGKLRSGRSDNLTVRTMLTLANGLGVNAHDVFTAASGVASNNASHLDPLVLLEQMQKLIHNPRGLEVLQKWFQLPPEQQQKLFDLLDCINQQPAKAKKKSRKK
jgi:transcriptional regulator with XRE-family HTH domain